MKDRFLTGLALAWCSVMVCVVSAPSAPLDCGPFEWCSDTSVKSARDYAGFWINTNPNLHFIQFIEIVADSPNYLKIRAWLRCHPTPAEGGSLSDCLYWEEDEVNTSSSEEIIWKHDESQMDGDHQRTVTFKNILTLEGGDTLRVFTDGPGWTNYFKRGKLPSPN